MDEYGRLTAGTTTPVRDGAAVATDRAAEARRNRTEGGVTVGAENPNHEERDEHGADTDHRNNAHET